jgi:pilus assembly protein CpaC
MYQTSNNSRNRGTESGFWKGTPWRSLVLCAASLAATMLTAPVQAQQYPGSVTPPPAPQYAPAPQANPQGAAHSAPPQFQLPNTVPTMNMGYPNGLVQVQGAGEPPLGKNPEKVPGGGDLLPPPRSTNGPFGPNQIRMPLMDGSQVLGTTPVPDSATIAKFKKYVEKFVDPQNTLDLIKSRVRLIILKETPKRIQMGDESIAVYNLVSPREITMIGRAAGSTVLNLWFVDDMGKEVVLSYLVRVFPDPEEKERLERIYKALEDEVNRVFPDSVIHVRLVGDKIVVTGQAHDSVEATQIIRLLRANAPGAAANPDIPVEGIRPVQRDGSDKLAPGLENYQFHSRAEVINMLRVPGEQQVMLKVTVAEVNRTAARSIGLNFTLTNNNGIQFLANLTGAIGTGNVPVLLDNGQVSLAINALKSLNYARSLAEPNLTTLNGMPAFFQAGGQFPVPIVTGATAVGLQGTTFVPFGVSLNFTPYITDKDRIRLAMNANVSTRDASTGANIGNTAVPGLTTRTFATTVELREGQTMAVAGLIQNNLGADRQNLPFFGDIPIVNRLTGLDKTSHGEQELVILVTPELVHPMEYKEVPPLPGSDLFEPSDCEFYLLGRLESRRPYDYRSTVMNDLARQQRYRHCEQSYIFGPTGHTNGDAIGCTTPAAPQQ